MQSAHYEYIVVGNGLMGSAATRYLSQWSDRVALIGPGEPADHSRHEGVFSSHYDEGRLAHKHSQDPIWDVISRCAVVYPELEAQSGSPFTAPPVASSPTASPPKNKPLIEQWIATVDPAGETLRFYPASDRSGKRSSLFHLSRGLFFTTRISARGLCEPARDAAGTECRRAAAGLHHH
ncbi:MAG: hypothetical protein R2932_47065 [Caldilineaceae bacterium]